MTDMNADEIKARAIAISLVSLAKIERHGSSSSTEAAAALDVIADLAPALAFEVQGVREYFRAKSAAKTKE